MRALLSVVVLMNMLPKVALQCLSGIYHQKKITVYLSEFVGRGMQRIEHRTLMINNRPLADFDLWLHYLKGNLDLVGPERLSFKEAWLLPRNERRRYNVAPGIISPYKVKRVSGIAHKTEREIAVEFADTASVSRRFQLVMIWCVQRVLCWRPGLETPSTFSLFGVELSNVSMAVAVKAVMSSLSPEHAFKRVSKFAFVNADCANQVFTNQAYTEILNSFEQVYPDGVGVKAAARLQGYALRENVNGTDMFPLLCAQLQVQKKSLYLHGATLNVVTTLVETLRVDYPSLRIAGYSDGYSYTDKPEELRERINRSGADLLLVAMGAPRQEMWINENVSHLNVKAVMGVGGLFDFYSGAVSRAPEWLRELSLEWVWRLLQQPEDKLRRYLVGNPLFLIRCFMASLSASSTGSLFGRQS